MIGCREALCTTTCHADHEKYVTNSYLFVFGRCVDICDGRQKNVVKIKVRACLLFLHLAYIPMSASIARALLPVFDWNDNWAFDSRRPYNHHVWCYFLGFPPQVKSAPKISQFAGVGYRDVVYGRGVHCCSDICFARNRRAGDRSRYRRENELVAMVKYRELQGMRGCAVPICSAAISLHCYTPIRDAGGGHCGDYCARVH